MQFMIVLTARPHGLPQMDNFRLEQAAMSPMPPGGVLLRVLYLSLDPYMRGRMDDRESYAKPVAVGEVMPGQSVAEVIASDHPGYAKGDIVLAQAQGRRNCRRGGCERPGRFVGRPARQDRRRQSRRHRRWSGQVPLREGRAWLRRGNRSSHS